MNTLPSQMRLLGQTLVALLAMHACRSGVGVQAAIVEVDLVFPRNDTYRPGLIPILFAIQNSALAIPLTMRVAWEVWDVVPAEDGGNLTRVTSESRRLVCDELSQSDPFFITPSSAAQLTLDREAEWVILWSVVVQNCSVTNNDTQLGQFGQPQLLSFTTRRNAQQPDVLQNTGACASSPGITLNVTDTLPIEASLNHGRGWCNALAPGPLPAANVCAIAMGPVVAAAVTKITPSSYCESVTSTANRTPTHNAAALADAAGPWLGLGLLPVIGVMAS